MNRSDLEKRIREIIVNYRVNAKWEPGERGRCYAVYAGPSLGRMRPNPDLKQVSGNLTSREANNLKIDLIVADLVDLFEQESKNVHEE